MKTRLDETNKMRKLMGLSLLTEESTYTGGTDTVLGPGEDPHALPDTPKSPEKIVTLDNIEDSPLDIHLKLSKEQGKELEEELNAAVKELENLKFEKNLNKMKLKSFLEQLRSNRVSGRILKRENKKIEKLQRQIEKLENTTPETRKAASKKILKGILGVLAASLSIVVMKDHPLLKGLLRKISSLKIPNSTTSPNSGGGVVPIGGNLGNTSGGGHQDVRTP